VRKQDSEDTCRSCHYIYSLFWFAHEYVMDAAMEAQRLGPNYGFFLINPLNVASTVVRWACLQNAEKTGGLYVVPMNVTQMQTYAERCFPHGYQSAEILDTAPGPGHVYLTVLWYGCAKIKLVRCCPP
jgi:hypothetical protein